MSCKARLSYEEKLRAIRAASWLSAQRAPAKFVARQCTDCRMWHVDPPRRH